MAYVPTAYNAATWDTNGQLVNFPGHDYFDITSFNAADWTYSFTNSIVPVGKSSDVATAGAAALTLAFAQISFGIVACTPTIAQTLTTDTAANIIAGFNWKNVDDLAEKEAWQLTLINKSNFAITLAGGAGVTLVGNATIVAANAAGPSSVLYSVHLLAATTIEIVRLTT
tara:strand:- start:45 stop:554 length:510 start_codon:yes stop_codon:yes gene_type:complete